MTYSFTYSSEVKPVKTTEKLSIDKMSLLAFVKSVLGTLMKAEVDSNKI